MVIVADDEPLIRLVLRGALERDGYAVIDAENGADGVALARESKPDAAIVDARMPGLSLAETIDGLRAVRDDLPVLVLSGDITVPVEATMPHTSYLPKPADTQMLLSTLHALLEGAAHD